jgi:uncharacterized protein YdeI (YjbR/CyaY-like superfamily)
MNEPSLYLPTREAWRNWLVMHHDTEPFIWLIHYKKHTGKSSIPYNDAVEEALCFGWIDSLIQRIDGERYMQKYTPRKPRSTWSQQNVRRVEKMIAAGKMTARGMELYEFARKEGLLPEKGDKADERKMFPETPAFFTRAMEDHPEAQKNFNALAPSYKLQYLGWIMDAKREDTRQRRLKEAIELLGAGKKLGMK